MKLISLAARNFMPFRGDVTVPFPTDPSRNVMLVFGENMRGKTSLLNAIRWAFYGKALGRHLREIPLHELVNKEAALLGEWEIECRVSFEAEGHFYELARRATKKSIVAIPQRAEDFDIVVGLQRDSLPIAGHLIESEINRFAPEQVSRFFLFDGELLQEYELLLVEGSEQGRRIKEAIEQVLGVPTLMNGRSDLGHLLKTAQRQQSKELGQVQGLERLAEKQSDIQHAQESLEADLSKLRGQLSERKAERSKLDDEIEGVEAVHKAKLRFDELHARIDRLDDDQHRLESEYLTLLKQAWKEVLQRKLREKLTTLTSVRLNDQLRP